MRRRVPFAVVATLGVVTLGAAVLGVRSAPHAHSVASAPTTSASSTTSTTGRPNSGPPGTPCPSTPPGSPFLSAEPQSRFLPPIQAAFAHLRTETGLPLAGPLVLPAYCPLSATAMVTADGGYIVGLYRCSPSLPLNDPNISSCEASADTLGSFSVTPEPTSLAAGQALVRTAVAGGYSTPMVACPSDAPTVVLDGQRIATCGSFPAIGALTLKGPTMASWYEGDWTIVYSLDGIRTWQEQVRPLVEALNEVLLPPFPGWFGVDEAGDGEHSSAVWAIGSNVFGVFDYHDAVGAAVMASSTRGLMSTDNG